MTKYYGPKGNSLEGLNAGVHSPNLAQWVGTTMAYRAKKTEHIGAKHGTGAYWGPKREAKRESNKLRRRQEKRMVEEQEVAGQTEADTSRAALKASAGGWKDTVDAETLIKNIYESRLISTRPVPKLAPPDKEAP